MGHRDTTGLHRLFVASRRQTADGVRGRCLFGLASWPVHGTAALSQPQRLQPSSVDRNGFQRYLLLYFAVDSNGMTTC